MTAGPMPVFPSGSGEPVSLTELASDQLRRRSRHGPHGPALTVLGVRGETCRPLRHGFDQVPDLLLGFELPARFGAVMAVASSVVTSASTRYEDAHLAVAVSRTGEERCVIASGAAMTETSSPQGWLIDACRRSVGLATPSESAHPLDLPIALWLDRLLVELVHSVEPVEWIHAVQLCPTPMQWRVSAPEPLGRMLGSMTVPWARLRAAVIRGEPVPVPVEPEHAAWMDHGMFIRWCLGFFPDVVELRSDVEFLAPPAIADAVDLTIRSAHDAYDAAHFE